MSPPTNQIERLDLVAKAITGREAVRRRRWVFLILNLVLAAMAVGLLRQLYGPWRPDVFALCALLASAIMWSNWRFRLYVYGGWWVALGLATLLIKGSTPLAVRLFVALDLGMIGFDTLARAGPLATVSTPEWDRDRAQVDQWWQTLSAPEIGPNVIEFSVGDFTSGYYRYRLMKPGQFWVVAKKYKGWARMKTTLRVYELGEVTLQPFQAGEVTATIRGKTVHGTDFTPALPGQQSNPV